MSIVFEINELFSEQKFRKIPLEVEAVQWTGDNWEEMKTFGGGDVTKHDSIDTKLIIKTLEGDMEVSLNDWVICGELGEHWPVKPEAFKKTYEDVFETFYKMKSEARQVLEMFE